MSVDPMLDFSVDAMELAARATPVRELAEALLAQMDGMPRPLIDGVRNILRYCAGKPQVLFGPLLRERREEAGLSRRKLAAAAKLSPATIKFIENGKTNPTQTTLLHLLRVDPLKLTWEDMPRWMMRPRSTEVA